MPKIVFTWHPPSAEYITLRPSWEVAYVDAGVQQGKVIVVEYPGNGAPGATPAWRNSRRRSPTGRRGIAMALARTCCECWPRCVVSHGASLEGSPHR
jgi:hypothetical protein